MNPVAGSTKCGPNEFVMNYNMKTTFPAASLQTRSAKPTAGSRRRASVLILVMAVLGVLFVTGIAFMATMNWQSRMVEREQQARVYELGVAQIESVIENVLREQIVRPGGRTTPADELTTVVQKFIPIPDPMLPPMRDEYKFNTPSYSLGYGNNPLIAQVEPQFPKVPYQSAFQVPEPNLANAPDNLTLYRRDRQLIYQNITDLEVLVNGPQYMSAGRVVHPINLDAHVYPNFEVQGPLGRRLVDADGDGMNDTWEVDLASIGVSGDAIRELGRVVNPVDNPNGKVRVGLRIVPHGAFVDLNQSHPLMINNVFPASNNLWVASAYNERKNFPYVADIEEPGLRHRGFLPQFKIPQSGIQGSSLLDPNLDPLGDGDFSSQMFSTATSHFPDGESVFDFRHRYWMFSAAQRPNGEYEEVDGMLDTELPPFVPMMDRDRTTYDRRSLVTSINHDDLNSRGALFNNQDVVSLMRDVNCGTAVFEYPNYPQTLENDPQPLGTVCNCANMAACDVVDPRKGRLQMSLPWLETGPRELYSTNTIAHRNSRRSLRQSLVHETFMQMLLRARSPEFGSFTAQGVWQPNFDNIQTAAASLTANLLDYADKDVIPNNPVDQHTPTAIAMRRADFSNTTTVGRTLNTPPLATDYVFGVEEQPYITELVSRTLGDDQGNPIYSGGSPTFYAVELYNPYDHTIQLTGYSLYFWDHRNPSDVRIVGLQNTQIPMRGFVYFYSGNPSGMNLEPGGIDVGTGNIEIPLGGSSGPANPYSYVYLVRNIQTYDDQNVLQTFNVVADQFALGTGCMVGTVNNIPTPIYSTQRIVRQDDGAYFSGRQFPWTAPVPIECADNQFENMHTLGLYNGLANTNMAIPRPVNIDLANQVDFDNAASDVEMRLAFPTTGSMLLMTRHANRAWDLQAAKDGEPLAFTAHLDYATPNETTPIDNGRLPIFDKRYQDHWNPQNNPTVSGQTAWPIGRPGELYHLPWGQMIFDYFTALPLYNMGPFEVAIANNAPVEQDAQPKVDMEGLRVHGRINIDVAPWKAMQGTPKVPIDSLMGLSADVRNTIALFAGLDQHNAMPIGEELAKGIVAYREAREICEPLNSDGVNQCSDTTGDYHGNLNGTNMEGGRGWDSMSPQYRRGNGFLTVGELVNVTSNGAYAKAPASPPPGFTSGMTDRQFTDFSPYRMDSGVLDWNPNSPGYNFYQDYVAAVANLVALGDWVTVKSHVFTVYAIIRGEPVDPAINPNSEQERDNRALRLQETVDRLPVLLGQQKPSQIGERTLGLYKDVQNN